MTPKDFNALLDRRIEKIRAVLASKELEYSSGRDRLHNFKVAARIDEETPKEACWGMAKKHLVSVIDMIKGDTLCTQDMVDEKVGDLINYLILLEGCFSDERGEWPG